MRPGSRRIGLHADLGTSIERTKLQGILVTDEPRQHAERATQARRRSQLKGENPAQRLLVVLGKAAHEKLEELDVSVREGIANVLGKAVRIALAKKQLRAPRDAHALPHVAHALDRPLPHRSRHHAVKKEGVGRERTEEAPPCHRDAQHEIEVLAVQEIAIEAVDDLETRPPDQRRTYVPEAPVLQNAHDGVVAHVGRDQRTARSPLSVDILVVLPRRIDDPHVGRHGGGASGLHHELLWLEQVVGVDELDPFGLCQRPPRVAGSRASPVALVGHDLPIHRAIA